MRFDSYSFRHASTILQEPEFIALYGELINVIEGISDEHIINEHNAFGEMGEDRIPKSISKSINNLLKQRLLEQGWSSESNIFQHNDYTGDAWRLDFAKQSISVEVAFNHSTVTAWNLIKPVLASELNHVQKAIQTRIGVIITATKAMKIAGGFDGAVGYYEKYLEHLAPLRNLLTVPLLIIGLLPPETFIIEDYQLAPRKKIGRVVML
ncbi:BglII/BstYI family type II restriction endonuclease [uncultured Croceitalea sp.]|uniref:BglII/BstYI family type II restriction endonuclease n=1 Tax=uncultured Croceitalea sp. TaxID=1798908 RepID=UPI003305C6BD